MPKQRIVRIYNDNGLAFMVSFSVSKTKQFFLYTDYSALINKYRHIVTLLGYMIQLSDGNTTSQVV